MKLGTYNYSGDANEISGITEGGSQTAWWDPTYDAAGNMVTGPASGDTDPQWKRTFTYDAWNRLVAVDASNDVTMVTYEYDGQNRRIVKNTFDKFTGDPIDTFGFYYNESWQVLEVRKDGDTDPLKQYVWHPYCINPELSDRHTGNDRDVFRAREKRRRINDSSPGGKRETPNGVAERYGWPRLGSAAVTYFR